MNGCAVSLTGDPITVGHRDIIKRANAMFGRVVVLLARDSSKKGSLLSYADRKALVECALREDGLSNFEVRQIEGTVVDCAKAAGVGVIVRGLRNEQDLVYEMDMSAINHLIMPDIETVYLPCRPSLSYVSSSAVRELARLGKFDIAAKFSSVDAAMRLKRRLTKTVAITGGIACGKSVAQRIFESRGWMGIDCDELNRELLDDVEYCCDVIEEVKKLGGGDVRDVHSFGVDRKKLAAAVFGSAEIKKAVEKLAFPAIAKKLDKKLSCCDCGQPFRVVVQAPLLFDDSAERFPFDFDRTVCITSSSAEQTRRMTEDRGYSAAEASARLASQMPPDEKAGRCDYVLRNDGSLADFEKAVNGLIDRIEEDMGK